MSIEKALADLTVALQENTKAVLGGKTATKAADNKTPAADTAGAAAGPKHTLAEVNAVMTEVKEKKGTAAAKTIIKDVGGADKMKDVTADKYDALYDAGKKALAAEDDGL